MSLSASNFCCKANFSHLGEIARVPCSCIGRFKSLLHISPSTDFCHPKLHLNRTSPFAQNSWLRASITCRVRSDRYEDNVTGESIVLDEQTLTRELQVAIDEENYTEAAKIRDSLRLLKEDSKASVLAANARFYNAFRKGDLATMQTLWAKGDNVCCVHPGASGVLGYDDVMESWELVWMNYEFPLEIELKNISVHFRGDVGYVTCVEFVRTKGSSWGAQFVTNVFERIDGHWFISIHHASPVDL